MDSNFEIDPATLAGADLQLAKKVKSFFLQNLAGKGDGTIRIKVQRGQVELTGNYDSRGRSVEVR